MNFVEVFKKLKCQKVIELAKRTGRLNHAYLIFGEDSRLIFEYLKFLAKDFLGGCGACGDCQACVLISKNTHPDLLFFPENMGEKLGVPVAEKILSRVYSKPMIADKKVIVIATMENMSELAENKLLKVLEEPPKDTYFLLGTSNIETCLQTIKSRTVKLPAENFSYDEIMQFIKGEEGSEEKKSLAASGSSGLLFSALDLLSSDKIVEETERAIAIIEELKSSADVLKVTKYFDDMDEYGMMKIMLTLFRDMLMIKSENENLVTVKGKRDILERLSQGYEKGTLIESITVLSEYINSKNFYINKTSLIDGVLLKLLEVKYHCQL